MTSRDQIEVWKLDLISKRYALTKSLCEAATAVSSERRVAPSAEVMKMAARIIPGGDEAVYESRSEGRGCKAQTAARIATGQGLLMKMLVPAKRDIDYNVKAGQTGKVADHGAIVSPIDGSPVTQAAPSMQDGDLAR